MKVFDRTVLDAVEKVKARIEELRQAKVGPQQLQLKFADSRRNSAPANRD